MKSSRIVPSSAFMSVILRATIFLARSPARKLRMTIVRSCAACRRAGQSIKMTLNFLSVSACACLIAYTKCHVCICPRYFLLFSIPAEKWIKLDNYFITVGYAEISEKHYCIGFSVLPFYSNNEILYFYSLSVKARWSDLFFAAAFQMEACRLM